MRSNKKTGEDKRRIDQSIINIIKENQTKFQSDHERDLPESEKTLQRKRYLRKFTI